MQCWKVLDQNDSGEPVCIEKVFFTDDCDSDYVLRSLINHDGYSPTIRVEKDKR